MKYRLFYSEFALGQEGTKEITVRRSLRERLLTWPWRPWRKTRSMTVPNWVPCIYKAGDMIIAHPSFRPAIERGEMT